jgi:uncharacterized protein (DUF2252 family)
MSGREVLMSTVKSQVKESVAKPEWPAVGSLLTPSDRAAVGKAARVVVPREDHAVLDVPSDRADPVDLLQSQAKSRVAELVPVRYGRMLTSPFAYFRGAALPMAADLAYTPVTGFIVQACGDAHLSNFGVFGTPERRLVFDINDFDETLPGPWEWDVKRLAASMEVAARENGFTRKQRRNILLAVVGQYRQAMRGFAGMTNLDVWYSHADLDQLRVDFRAGLTARMRKVIDQGLATARTKDSMQALAKLTTMTDGQRKIVANPPLVVPLSDLLARPENAADVADQIPELLKAYRRTLREDSAVLLGRYELADLAMKVVGVGSVGTRCWIALMLGAAGSDPLFLQVKEAEKSVLSGFAGPGEYSNQGQRVVVGQRFTQAASDIFLGWMRIGRGVDGRSHDYYVRQLRDWKFSIDINAMVPGGMRRYGALCGWTLARAHARTGDRIAIASYLGSSAVFDNAIADFAAAYADLTERDYVGLVGAADTGRITAERGV